MKKSLKIAFLISVFTFMPFMSVNAESRIVNSQDELKVAVVDDTVDTIVLGGDIQTTEKINIMRPVIIDGANHAITYIGTTYAYVLQFYKTTGTLKNIKLTGADGALLVNGSVVTLEGNIDVSGNRLGGIELGKGSGVTEFPDIIADDATIINTTESSNAPTAWLDISLDDIEKLLEGSAVSDEEIEIESWQFKGAALLTDKVQIQMFLDRANVPTGENVIDLSDEFAGKNDSEVEKSADNQKTEDNVATKNPNTYDSSILYLLFAIVSFIALGYSYAKATSR